jgi:hypothetical protein
VDDDTNSVEAERLMEFRELVQWWQFPSVPLGPLDQQFFTHGGRIRTYNGYLDQIQQVVGALRLDPTTSRGIVLLLNPPADRIAQMEIPFPSFCLVQFRVQLALHSDSPTLDCTAYFRKQEVRYWWLVNLAELSELQRSVCEALRQETRPELRKIRPGGITTVAARSHAGQGAPKVQVPLVDRYYGLSKERLVAMVHALVWEQLPSRAGYAKEWLRVFSELTPPEIADPDGVAVAQEGIRYLRDEIGCYLGASRAQQDEPLAKLHRALEQLHTANQGFALLQQTKQVTDDRYDGWRATVTPLIVRIVDLGCRRITAEDVKQDN